RGDGQPGGQRDAVAVGRAFGQRAGAEDDGRPPFERQAVPAVPDHGDTDLAGREYLVIDHRPDGRAVTPKFLGQRFDRGEPADGVMYTPVLQIAGCCPMEEDLRQEYTWTCGDRQVSGKLLTAREHTTAGSAAPGHAYRPRLLGATITLRLVIPSEAYHG